MAESRSSARPRPSTGTSDRSRAPRTPVSTADESESESSSPSESSDSRPGASTDPKPAKASGSQRTAPKTAPAIIVAETGEAATPLSRSHTPGQLAVGGPTSRTRQARQPPELPVRTRTPSQPSLSLEQQQQQKQKQQTPVPTASSRLPPLPAVTEHKTVRPTHADAAAVTPAATVYPAMIRTPATAAAAAANFAAATASTFAAGSTFAAASTLVAAPTFTAAAMASAAIKVPGSASKETDGTATDRGRLVRQRTASGRATSAALIGGAANSAGGGGTAAANVHTAFPPLADPATEPDVEPAPASGMYWSRAPVSGIVNPPLRAHTTTMVGSSIYVFGGCDSRACFNKLYMLDGDSFHWYAPTVGGDVPLPLRAMTCTAVGKKLVVFGGGDGPSYYNDVYVLDTQTCRWSRPRISGSQSPSRRRAHTACLYKGGLYIFGGGDGVQALNDIWRLDVGDPARMSWRLIASPGPAVSTGPGAESGRDLRPKARGYHTANMVGGKLIVYGGSDGGECFGDVWVYDLDRGIWCAVEIEETYRRLSHTSTLVGSYLFIVGGHDGDGYLNHVLLLNLTTMTWDRRITYGQQPAGRGYHGTALYDSRLFMIGGFDGSEVFGDTWILELAVHAYYAQISNFSIVV